MVWPAGFMKQHKKDKLEYRSDQSLHKNFWPMLPTTLTGGVIIDFKDENIDS